MYRPEGWKKGIKANNKNTYTTDDLNRMYEAGADAVLEGLKKDSPMGVATFYTSASGEVCSREGLSAYIPCGDKEVKGYLVFIPEEGV